MSVLAPSPDFDADDGFLHALLGLLAGAEEMRAPLAHLSSSPEREPPEGADPVLDALLGLIRLRVCLCQGIEALAGPEPPSMPEEPADPGRAPPVEDVLR